MIHSGDFQISRIEEVRRSVREAKALVEEQTALVERLERKGLPTAAARSLLLSLLGCVYVLQERLERLELREDEAAEPTLHSDESF